MARRLDHEQPDQEPDTIHELKELAPGMWQYPTDQERCCIYRVQHSLRRVNPEAYTPQLLLIGPLHHSLKSQVFKSPGDIRNTKVMGYLNMEEHKKIYLSEFDQKHEGKTTIHQLRRVIKEEEGNIRASYSESTAWIKSPDFIEMILLDSVFILEFLLRSADYCLSLRSGPVKTGDLILDQTCLQTFVHQDLMLLENQLPYFILEKLFDPVVPILHPNLTLRELVIIIFGFHGKIRDNSTFRHFTDLYRLVRVETLGSEKPTKTKFKNFTDLFRRVRVETLGSEKPTKTKFKNFTDLLRRGSREPAAEYRIIKHMYNAEKLYSAGVKFKAVKDELSIDVRFENGCLKLPSLWVRDNMEIILRNIMALEQYHYPFQAYVCDYVSFLDFLIDTDKDVDLLIEKGILHNWIGEQSSVAEMVNKLFLGIVTCGSYYYDIALKVNAYYESPVNRSRAVLGRMYFGNLWTGTATVAATLLLVMTLIQTVCSIIQVMQK